MVFVVKIKLAADTVALRQSIAALFQTGAVSAVFDSKYTVCPSYARLSGPTELSAYFRDSTYIEISWRPLPSN